MPEQPAVTRDRILDVAESLFARKGYDGTTIKQIGGGAGLNPALIYYYFAGKEDLYKAVLQRFFDTMLAQGVAVLDGTVPPAEAIRRLLALQAEWLLARPNLYRLLVREMVDHDARHAQEIMLQMAAGPFQRLCRVIEQGQQSGSFRTDLEPRSAAVSTIAQVVYFFIFRPAVGIFFGQGPAGVADQTARDFARHAGEFALSALSPPGKTA
jgi:TetR/AcrR family transcriptional regulator